MCKESQVLGDWEGIEQSKMSSGIHLCLFRIIFKFSFSPNAEQDCIVYGKEKKTSLRVCLLSRFSRVRLSVAPWTVAHQAPPAMGFSRQEYWSGLPCPSPGNLPDRGIEPTSIASPALAGRFFTTSAAWEVPPSPGIMGSPPWLWTLGSFITHWFCVLGQIC